MHRLLTRTLFGRVLLELAGAGLSWRSQRVLSIPQGLNIGLLILPTSTKAVDAVISLLG